MRALRSEGASWRMSEQGRLRDSGGLGPANYGFAQKGGGPVDLDKRGLLEVTTS